jgi:hypothetical protein
MIGMRLRINVINKSQVTCLRFEPGSSRNECSRYCYPANWTVNSCSQRSAPISLIQSSLLFTTTCCVYSLGFHSLMWLCENKMFQVIDGSEVLFCFWNGRSRTKAPDFACISSRLHSLGVQPVQRAVVWRSCTRHRETESKALLMPVMLSSSNCSYSESIATL